MLYKHHRKNDEIYANNNPLMQDLLKLAKNLRTHQDPAVSDRAAISVRAMASGDANEN